MWGKIFLALVTRISGGWLTQFGLGKFKSVGSLKLQYEHEMAKYTGAVIQV